RGEVAPAEQEAVECENVVIAGKESSHDLTAVVDPTESGCICPGHVDRSEIALAEQEALAWAAEVSHDLAAVVDPKGTGGACPGHGERGEDVICLRPPPHRHAQTRRHPRGHPTEHPVFYRPPLRDKGRKRWAGDGPEGGK